MTREQAIEKLNAKQNAENIFTNITEADIEAEMKKEEATMKTTTFELNGTTYTMNPATNRYSKTVNGKTTRIGKAEYEAAERENEIEHRIEETDRISAYDTLVANQIEAEEEAKVLRATQEELDKDPSFVDPMADLQKPAVLNECGCVDCSECKVPGCVHRNCMRRNPRSEGGLAECPRLSVKVEEEVKDLELEQIEEEIPGIEDAEAELERNIRNEQKKLDKAMEKLGYHRIDSEGNDIRYATDAHEVMAWNTVEEGLKWVKGQTKKTRRSKDIAYEGNGVTLTTKQVDFILHIADTDFWTGFDNSIFVDALCDQIGGQFEEKPMTVGAMISTLCEKGLAYRGKDRVNGHKATYMRLTELGKKVARELGLD